MCLTWSLKIKFVSHVLFLFRRNKTIGDNIILKFFLIRIVWGGVQTGSTRHVSHFWPIGTENRSTRRKPAPAPLCPPQIPLDQTRARTRAAAVGSQRLISWAMARSLFWSWALQTREPRKIFLRMAVLHSQLLHRTIVLRHLPCGWRINMTVNRDMTF
jgi:hypothetical protein